ncbi:dynein regulatory complex subunit 2-like [Schistocerca serialis cubense]|uniref:dynein regulatory complex subunit 2-like n=1 Tax=Schistocerca serialis cubense TaxID=2023355 RepID=UPI00214DF40E|nr:dynein regulatory complex subunit 2-like [Schistocerca serialis cubense]
MAVSSVNRKAVQRKYRDIIYRTQMPILKQDVETMWHRFDFGLELKNYVISSLLDEIDFEDWQAFYNQRDHTAAVDRLLESLETIASRTEVLVRPGNVPLQYVYSAVPSSVVRPCHLWPCAEENERRLVEVRTWYEAERDRLLAAGAEFRRRVEEAQRHGEEDLGATLWRMRAEHNAATAAYHDDAETRTCELRNEYSDTMNLMRSERERRVNLLWARCHGTVADYRQRTAPRRKEHDRLQRLDSDSGDERLADLYEELHDLQLQLQEVRQYQSDRLGVLRKERDNYGTLYTTLMNDKEAGTLTDKKQAMHLAVCCAATTKRLQQLQKKAELILELTTLCRKYELQEEKVVPFQKSSVEVPDATGQEMQRAMIMEQLQGTSDTLTLMDHFWQKVAKVQMRHTELQLVHNQLQEENRELRQALCNYLQELAPHKEVQLPF